MIFPRIPLYQETACFFLGLMYNFPFVYLLFGIFMWLLWPGNGIVPPREKGTGGTKKKLPEFKLYFGA